MSVFYRRYASFFTFFAVIGVFLGTIFVFVGVFFWYGRGYAKIELNVTYYFLARECEETTVSAVAGQSYLLGGAGYIYEENGRDLVLLACYFKESEALSVQEKLTDKGVETSILTLSIDNIVLIGENAAHKNGVSSYLSTMQTCAQTLYDAANGLERATLNQEEGRAVVNGVVTSLKGLCNEFSDEFYSLLNIKITEAVKRGAEICEGIIYSKDLRFLQIQLCLFIVNADRYFS